MSEVGLVAEKPPCKQDEKWPWMLSLRKGEARGKGGDWGELESRCQLCLSASQLLHVQMWTSFGQKFRLFKVTQKKLLLGTCS